jgi:hypothetical protein
MADAAEENLDLHVMLGGIAPRNRSGSKRRCRAGNGIGFCVVHEFPSTPWQMGSADGEQLARESD